MKHVKLFICLTSGQKKGNFHEIGRSARRGRSMSGKDSLTCIQGPGIEVTAEVYGIYLDGKEPLHNDMPTRHHLRQIFCLACDISLFYCDGSFFFFFSI